MDIILLRDGYKINIHLFKTILFTCGLIGLINTCLEVRSYGTFKELHSVYDLDMAFVNLRVRYIYKSITFIVILIRILTLYPYIMLYVLMLFAIVIDSKWIIMLWLRMWVIRSLYINIIVTLTGLCTGFIINSNRWIILDFFLFKLLQIVLSSFFCYGLWILYQTPEMDNSNRQLTKKRRASFCRFGLNDKISQNVLNSTLENDSLSDVLNDTPHDSDYEFVDTVQRSPSLNSLVNKNLTDWFVNEANSVDEDDSSLFSLDLAQRAERFLKLTSEEISNISKLKTPDTMNDISISINRMIRLPPLLPINNIGKSHIDLADETLSETELKSINYNVSESKTRSSEIDRKDLSLTPETLLGIFFYKYHYYKPKMEDS